jgi:adenine nucleotide transporter 17
MIKKIYNEEGIGGFFKGSTPSLVLTLNPVIQFTTYDLLKSVMSKKNRDGKLTYTDIFIISSISKLFTVLSNYPLITAKTLCQANTKLNSSQMLGMLMSLLNSEGILGFYKGIGSKVVGSLLNNIILMVIYEKIQNVVRLSLARAILSKQIIPNFN